MAYLKKIETKNRKKLYFNTYSCLIVASFLQIIANLVLVRTAEPVCRMEIAISVSVLLATAVLTAQQVRWFLHSLIAAN